MCRAALVVVFASLLFTLNVTVAQTPHSEQAKSTIPILTISGAIGPAVGDYVIEQLKEADLEPQVSAVVITLDTPGGLVSSLRDINQQILASQKPVLCLVYPKGARAASAGTYILYACHIAAMAPATTLGAATPVNIGSSGSDQEDEKSNEPSAMEKKVLNDSIAYIRSLAQLRGRNIEWAEKAVTEAATLSSQEALEMNVINLIADDPESLVAQLDGQVLEFNDQVVELNLSEATLIPVDPDWRHEFIATITNPNIAYILMIIGIYGLILEFYSPSFGIAGIIGAISLMLALYGLQMLPINYVGFGLIALGLLLLVAESLVPSFGLFGFSGAIAFVLGSIFLIDSDLPAFQVSVELIFTFALLSFAFIVFVLRRVWTLRKKHAVIGQEAILGIPMEASESFEEQGYIVLEGERWSAICSQPIHKGDLVEVVQIEGLTLVLRKLAGRKEHV
ncbi:NfeD family protein [Vibrio hangzhouensis]|uniref:Membrane-bound serine protease (ClpP class) n=1 Tax=Vibrio hangzhouensis TaxID=462991 RepID=A0A1H5VF33_9VIBR|nr:nodulation protein NfeD [Vibrio hangzhouensis]SEF85107.1 membrane-bound serine protease (ClpP class) [Vibrio hangzhouensis]